MQLHQKADHPLGILKNEIYKYFNELEGSSEGEGGFLKFDDFVPVVAAVNNFDELLIPSDHVSRSYNDTYYIDASTVLRTHTSAHQTQMLRAGMFQSSSLVISQLPFPSCSSGVPDCTACGNSAG